VHIRVRSSVGHGEHEWLVVGELEVLVGKLLAVDGLSTGTLQDVSHCIFHLFVACDLTYVAAGEVTTLKHELGNHTVELGVGVTEALLASAESTEVLDGLGDNLIEELEVDTAGALCKGQQVSKGINGGRIDTAKAIVRCDEDGRDSRVMELGD